MAAYSGLFDGIHNEPYALLHNTGVNKTGAGKLLNMRAGRRQANKILKELFDSLIGAASGGTAAVSHYRVEAEADVDSFTNGGARTIETVELINRATTAADITALKEIFTRRPDFATYIEDASNNGIGANQGLL